MADFSVNDLKIASGAFFHILGLESSVSLRWKLLEWKIPTLTYRFNTIQIQTLVYFIIIFFWKFTAESKIHAEMAKDVFYKNK